MGNFIAHALSRVINWIAPQPTGRHRALATPPVNVLLDTPTQPLPIIRPQPTAPTAHHVEPLPAENIADVRPYLVAHEQRVQSQDQRLSDALRACMLPGLAEVS